MAPLNEVWKLTEHCKTGIQTEIERNQTDIKTQCDLNRWQAETSYASNMVKYNVVTFYPLPSTGK